MFIYNYGDYEDFPIGRDPANRKSLKASWPLSFSGCRLKFISWNSASQKHAQYCQLIVRVSTAEVRYLPFQ